MYNLKTVKWKNIPGSLAAATEFAQATKGSRIIRSAFYKLLKELYDPKNNGRLTAKMLQVVQSNPILERGFRTVADGDLTYLEGFDFAVNYQLRRLLYVSVNTDINRKTGECTIHLPTFNPQENMDLRDNQTHVVFYAAAAEVNFERESFVSDIVKSDYLDIKKPVSLFLKPALPKASKNPILLALGLQFYSVINGEAYSSGNRKVSSFCIVQVENAPKLSGKLKKSK